MDWTALKLMLEGIEPKRQNKRYQLLRPETMAQVMQAAQSADNWVSMAWHSGRTGRGAQQRRTSLMRPNRASSWNINLIGA